MICIHIDVEFRTVAKTLSKTNLIIYD